ncbi:hypothetical protein KDA_38610 [Dictyobacter alpinus]|uniref:Zinc-ribbon domain-containing protein n=1 Tax=Dictyobacter alpinus TaxID=2014873 RepID=A0A402BAR2_9CHLR|nr:zinc ribbon domain-containing protein [Dictyobacter alpinus]GCE28377.1 hypothetical protein KDA_38610 [Dictyobacter alpinus]
MKPITGQYECIHSSGVGLDYFTSRIDRLVLQANSRFVLTTQNRSRAVNAAQSLMKGQQVSSAAPETRLEGSYSQQNMLVQLQFDHGGLEKAQLDADGSGLQIGPNHFNKVSDSTMLPPTHRLQKDMDDIAKGIKIATTLGGMAVKAAKTIQGTIQSVQETNAQQKPAAGTAGTAQQQPASTPQYSAPAQQQPATPVYQPPAQQQPATPVYQPPVQQQPAGHVETLFCDQCGSRIRPGKRFCNICGARLP